MSFKEIKAGEKAKHTEDHGKKQSSSEIRSFSLSPPLLSVSCLTLNGRGDTVGDTRFSVLSVCVLFPSLTIWRGGGLLKF